jgi:hypothetical protein
MATLAYKMAEINNQFSQKNFHLALAGDNGL